LQFLWLSGMLPKTEEVIGGVQRARWSIKEQAMTLEGTQLGNYRLQRLIGNGPRGSVYLAEETSTAQQVAVKVVPNEALPSPDTLADADAQQRFQSEMEALKALDHPHILPLLDVGEGEVDQKTYTYLVSPYHPLGTLADWLQQRQSLEPVPPAEVVEMVRQAAEALQYAHSRQLLHLDVKPSNFLLRRHEDNPRQLDLMLADFAVARLTPVTAGQTFRGAAPYVAPEQWTGTPGPATDQYALAMMAYFWLTSRVPFEGSSQEVMDKHLREQPQPPSAFNAHIPPAIDQVILTALEKKPEDRFLSVQVFATAFENIWQLQGVSASPAAAPENAGSQLSIADQPTLISTMPENAGVQLSIADQPTLLSTAPPAAPMNVGSQPSMFDQPTVVGMAPPSAPMNTGAPPPTYYPPTQPGSAPMNVGSQPSVYSLPAAPPSAGYPSPGAYPAVGYAPPSQPSGAYPAVGYAPPSQPSGAYPAVGYAPPGPPVSSPWQAYPAYGAPAPSAPPPRRTVPIWLIVGAVLLLVVVISGVAFAGLAGGRLFANAKPTTTAPFTPTLAPSPTPTFTLTPTPTPAPNLTGHWIGEDGGFTEDWLLTQTGTSISGSGRSYSTTVSNAASLAGSLNNFQVILTELITRSSNGTTCYNYYTLTLSADFNSMSGDDIGCDNKHYSITLTRQ
jgi:serine/threonine protein kinase